MSLVLKIALAGVLLASLALVPLPVVLFLCSDADAARWLLLVFLVLVAENIWTMFFRVRRAGVPKPIPNANMAFVGYAYAAVFYVSLFDFYLAGTPRSPVAMLVLGLAGVAAAKALHYWSTRHLARHTQDPDGLVRCGPYGAIRHPMYTAACLESLGVALFLGSWPGVAVSALVFVPLEYHRAVVEERALRDQLGQVYDDYVGQTSRLVGWPLARR